MKKWFSLALILSVLPIAAQARYRGPRKVPVFRTAIQQAQASAPKRIVRTYSPQNFTVKAKQAYSPRSFPVKKVQEPQHIIDSDITFEQALAGTQAPQHVIDRQTLLDVQYYGFDGHIHQGQIMIDARLAQDVTEFFAIAKELKFPIEHVAPGHIHHWDDDILMAENVTNGFNWRPATNLDWVSHHGYGYAFDVNPRQNRYKQGAIVYPVGAVYDPSVPGTLTGDHPLVQFMEARGWTWGGRWKWPHDPQHFQKVLERD